MTDAAQLTRVIAGWAAGGGPLYRQLADALIAAIERGDLPDGVALPPERLLARALAVSRSTVVGAFDLVKTAGLIEGQQGRGTVVTARAAAGPVSFAGELLYTAVLPTPPSTVDVIHLTSACQPAGQRLRAVLQHARTLDLPVYGHGYQPHGVPALREAIAAALTRQGLPTGPDQLVVTTGAQQAIALVAACIPPGSVALTEEVTFPGALDAFRRAGLRSRPVATDDGGVCVDDLRRHLAAGTPGLIHLSPSFNNPTGAELAPGRRARVAALAARAGVPILEDNTLDLLAIGPPAAPAIAGHARAGRVFTIGSLSKSAWGGLRTGWVRCTDPADTDRLVRTRAAHDLGGPILNQHLAVPVVAALDDIAAETRAVTAAAYHALREAAAVLTGWDLPRPRGGLCVWARTPGLDTDLLAQHALRHGLILTPGSLFRADGATTDRIRIPLVHAPAVTTEAVRRLAAAAHQLVSRSSPPIRHSRQV